MSGSSPEVDQYESDTHLCWYLGEPSEELLEALGSGWLGGPGRVVDLGCGLGTELRHLVGAGWCGLGVDLSLPALRRARAADASATFVCADVVNLPVRRGWADALIDRGCFHYLSPDQRTGYVAEAARVLKPGGRMLLRACLPHRANPDGITKQLLLDLFADWKIHSLVHRSIRTDRGTLDVLEGRFERRRGVGRSRGRRAIGASLGNSAFGESEPTATKRTPPRSRTE